MSIPCSVEQCSVDQVGEKLNDRSRSLTERFRALFTLKNLGGNNAIDYIARGFDDPSALLKHELAYCLGQMQDVYAIPILTSVLEDKSQEPMVRHEAGEALGAIASPELINILRIYSEDPVIEVAETCQLAVRRIQWIHDNHGNRKEENLSENPYASVDPAPPATEENTNKLQEVLLDESLPLFERYRAMFSLRNQGTTESVKALAEGLKCKSVLFKHEIAYVLGQMQHEAAITNLAESLADANENPMVRHECAEALGSVSKGDCLKILQNYLKDEERVVKESCEVALDMLEYETTNQFQYADGLHHTCHSSLSNGVNTT